MATNNQMTWEEQKAAAAEKRAELKRKIKNALYIGGGIFGFVLFLMSWPFTTVGPGNRGVVTHFGKVQNEILDEGLHMVTPFMTSVKEISVKVQKNDVKTESSTKDQQSVKTDVVVNWSLPPTKVNYIYQNIGNEQAVFDNIISPAVNEVFKASSAKLNAEEIIAKRNELTDDVAKNLMQRLSKYDVIVRDISLVNLGYGDEYSKAVEEKQVAQQKAQKYVYVAQQAEQEAIAKVNTAKGTRDAEVIEAEGKAQAQKLLESSLTPGILQKIAIDKWNGEFPQVLGGNGALPFINLKTPGKPKSEGETQ